MSWIDSSTPKARAVNIVIEGLGSRVAGGRSEA